MMIATPISALFDNDQDAREISQASDCLECRDRSLGSDLPRQYLLHLEQSIFQHWDEPAKIRISAALQARPELRIVSFHLATAYPEARVEDGMFVPHGQRLTDEQLYVNTQSNVGWLRSLVGPRARIAVENNNYYPTGAYETVTDGRFITRLVKENQLYFVCDLAHARISAANLKTDYDRYLAGLPMAECVQLHLSGHGRKANGLAYDQHALPDERLYQEVARISGANNQIAYLTVEYYQDKTGLLKAIERVRKIWSEVKNG